jgi:ParB/RepB/Spo0J family partition protein
MSNQAVLELTSLGQLDPHIPVMFRKLLDRANEDCQDRPTITKRRTVTLQVDLIPVWDENVIDELRASIQANGLQEPLDVLPANQDGKYELLDGERRYRALQGLNPNGRIAVKIRALSPAEASAFRLASFVRTGLNDIERALAYQRMAADGLSQADIGKLVGLTQGAVSNALRLLQAPEALQARVISGEMTARELRDALPFAHCPGVLDALAVELGRKDFREDLLRYSQTIPEWVEEYAFAHSRSIKKGVWNYCDGAGECKFKPTAEQREQLQVCTVPSDAGSDERAFNVPFWNELQQAAISQQ